MLNERFESRTSFWDNIMKITKEPKNTYYNFFEFEIDSLYVGLAEYKYGWLTLYITLDIRNNRQLPIWEVYAEEVGDEKEYYIDWNNIKDKIENIDIAVIEKIIKERDEWEKECETNNSLEEMDDHAKLELGKALVAHLRHLLEEESVGRMLEIE